MSLLLLLAGAGTGGAPAPPGNAGSVSGTNAGYDAAVGTDQTTEHAVGNTLHGEKATGSNSSNV